MNILIVVLILIFVIAALRIRHTESFDLIVSTMLG